MTDKQEQQSTDLFRLAALSDGIFGIMLTLLVLELKLPEAAEAASNGQLLALLSERALTMLAYLQTFLVSGLFWVAHHWDFEHIKRYDRRLLWMNLIFLLCISLLPFTTPLVSKYGDLSLGWGIYAANMILIGYSMWLTWRYAVAQGFVDPSVAPRVVRSVAMRHLIAPVVFGLSLGMALISPRIAQVSPLLILVGQVVVKRWVFGKDAGPHEESTARIWLWRIAALVPVILMFAAVIWMLFQS